MKKKILLINTYYKERSTGSTCFDIVESFNNDKYECKCIYFANVGKYENAQFFGNKYEQRLHSIISHFIGLEGYASNRTTKEVINYIDSYKPDIVHLFVLHSHILRLEKLFNKLNSFHCKVFIHLDDCWWFTGKCMHPVKRECSKYMSICHNCPALHDSPNSFFFDLSSKMQADKFKWINDNKNIKAIAVSSWVKKQAEESTILKNKEVILLNNWIDDSIYFPKNKEDKKRNKLLFVSSLWPKESTKYLYLLKLYCILKDSFEFTVIGDLCGNNMFDMNCLGVLKDPVLLVEEYRKHDIYVHLSEFDTFGKVIMEAIFCGTPVVAFDNTVMKDIVGDCGLLAKNKDIDDMADVIKNLALKYPKYIINIKNRNLSIFTKVFAMKELDKIYSD